MERSGPGLAPRRMKSSGSRCGRPRDRRLTDAEPGVGGTSVLISFAP
jgi:hypothetical protein